MQGAGHLGRIATRWILWVCLAKCSSSKQQSSRFIELVRTFDAESKMWMVDRQSPKSHLENAFSAIEELTRMFDVPEHESNIPEYFSRMDLAGKIFNSYQTKDHLRYAVPLIESDLFYKDSQSKYSLWDACFVDLDEMRRQCQDLYAMYCYILYTVGDSDKADKCVSDYNVNRPVDVQFQNPIHANRQLPGVRAVPVWWDTASRDEALAHAPFSFLPRIRAQFHTIQKEILHVLSTDSLVWSPTNLDLRLSTNPNWDPQKAWEAIVLNSYGDWREGCNILPKVCQVLQKEGTDISRTLRIGQDGSRYLDLIGHDRASQGYDEIPTLGIKLYRVLPKSGIKPHTGSSGRLVHSLTIVAPSSPSATLTVAGNVRFWREGHFLSFDDSFYHAVDNPHSEVSRIVLSIVTLHPDLLVEGHASINSEL